MKKNSFNMEKLTQKEIYGLIWIELVNSKYNAFFYDWLVANFDIKLKAEKWPDEWKNAKVEPPPKNTTVIGFFPSGDEDGKKVSTAILNDEGDLVSDFPNSTSCFFKATHWTPLPKSNPNNNPENDY